MALTSQQLAYLKNAATRFTAHVGLFPAYEPTVVPPSPGSGTLLTPLAVPRCAPRYQLAALGETVNLYCRDSYNRGGGYVGDANVTIALDGGSSGSVTDNGDGTATYEAPGAGSGIAQINITVNNDNGSKTGYAFVQYPDTTYDDVIAEITSISGGVDQHGYKMTMRARGDVSDFALGKLVHLHVEDTWVDDGVTSTFGGYQHHETIINAYISEMEYFEDWRGITWLGMELQSPWWILSRTPVGETYWGLQEATGVFWLTDFRPVDAIWKFLNDITDFTEYHDVVMWFDQNSIDDFIIDTSDLGTIVADVMERTLSIAYCDRYGSVFCIPDPDVRADEYWGTPAPQYTGSEALTPDLMTDYTVINHPYQVRKLVLNAFDRTKKGIFAYSENPTALGEIRKIRGLLCDKGETLASWAVQKRNQLNRAWHVEAGLPLNHTMDLCNFADVNLTVPIQTSGSTASGRTWLKGLIYRPDIYRGMWTTRWTLVHQTEGINETGDVSAWGGTGDYGDDEYPTGWPRYTGATGFGSGTGGWTAQDTGTQTEWCYFFDFTDNSGLFSALDENTPFISSEDFTGTYGIWLTATGWRSSAVSKTASGGSSNIYQFLYIWHTFPQRIVTGIKIWASSWGHVLTEAERVRVATYSGGTAILLDFEDLAPGGTGVVSWQGSATAQGLLFYYTNPSDTGTGIFASAQVAGLGTNPFGTDNCP